MLTLPGQPELHPDWLRVPLGQGEHADFHHRWLRHHCDRERHPQPRVHRVHRREPPRVHLQATLRPQPRDQPVGLGRGPVAMTVPVRPQVAEEPLALRERQPLPQPRRRRPQARHHLAPVEARRRRAPQLGPQRRQPIVEQLLGLPARGVDPFACVCTLRLVQRAKRLARQLGIPTWLPPNLEAKVAIAQAGQAQAATLKSSALSRSDLRLFRRGQRGLRGRPRAPRWWARAACLQPQGLPA